MKMTNSSGPDTVPCGIPLEVFAQVDDAPSTVTLALDNGPMV